MALNMEQKDKDCCNTDTLKDVLREMEETEGTVCCRYRDIPPYENLNVSSPLEEHVMNILHNMCVKSTFKSRGCHYQHVLDQVMQTVQYSKLHRTALLHILYRLEANSDVIRVSENCYMPF